MIDKLNRLQTQTTGMLRRFTPRKDLLLIILIAALVWSSSLTNEFTGYDDIKLIVDNKHASQGILHSLKFFWNTFSGSFNTAWSDYPTIIYRPLEQYAIAIGYKLWGTSAWHYHFFYNYLLHLVNSILVFLILKHFIKRELALLITAIWAVHPLHNEAVNMLTSGAGFLLAHCLLLTAILTIIKSNNKLVTVLASILLFISFLGSEMAMLAIPVLAIILWKKQDYFFKIGSAGISLLAYLLQRSSIINSNQDIEYISERIFVLAPQIWTNYLKLFFFPAKLSIDEQHSLILGDLFSGFHWLSLTLSFAFIALLIFFWKDKTLSASLILSVISISVSLGIIPAYCLARDRYSYLFCLFLTIVVVLIANKHIDIKILSYITIILVIILGTRSWFKNQDWQNGEKLWFSTINSTEDIGAKQVWRYRLLQYYQNPGTKSFQADPIIQKQTFADFNNFIKDNELYKNTVIDSYINPQSNLKTKYSYNGYQSIASGIFSYAMLLKKQKKYEQMIPLLNLAHYYHPRHFQTNLQLFVWDKNMSEKVIEMLYRDAQKHPIFAKSLLDTLYILKDPRHKEYAQSFYKLFNNSKAFGQHLRLAQKETNAQ